MKYAPIDLIARKLSERSAVVAYHSVPFDEQAAYASPAGMNHRQDRSHWFTVIRSLGGPGDHGVNYP
jgi:hypothetical protein